jgi:hypothetical protein
VKEQLEEKNVDVAKMVWKEDKMSERASKLGEGLVKGAEGKGNSNQVLVQVNFID